VDLRTGSIRKVEALIRWKHPERGMVFPDEFISLAKSIGLIEEIGEWVFHSAAQKVRNWREQIDPGV
jgi:EAL domain-containing protein (putative c-di-GMP-specific phosphodiesterase class I)